MNERQKKVRQVLAETSNTKFEYGTLDCVIFASKFVEALTGKDPMLEVEYHSEDQAYQIIQDHGGFVDLITDFLGEPTYSFGTLQDGDPVMIKLPVIGELMGVKVNGYIACKTGGGVIMGTDKYFQLGWSV